MRIALLLTLFCPIVPAQGQYAAGPVEGKVGQLRYSYHFDHNALQECVRVGDVLIALTASGNLLRFDAATLKMTGQQVVPGRGTAIALGAERRILVGTLGGRVWGVDPATLVPEPLFEAKGKIVWLGSEARMIVAAVDGRVDPWPWPGEKDKDFEARWRQLEITHGTGLSVIVSQGARQRVIRFAQTDIATPSAFLLDGGKRLWMGTDKGEWGGEYAELDLRSGNTKRIKTEAGVLGFLRLADGRVLAYGGMSHMGFDAGFIGRVDRGRLESFRQFGSRPATPPAIQKALNDEPPEVPSAPIDFMFEDEPDAYSVLSANMVYRANGDLSEWTKVADLNARWAVGRAYSMGSTPTARSIVGGVRGKDLIVVMAHDGLARVAGGKVEPMTFDGEIEAPIADVWDTPINTVFVMADALHAAWRLTDGRWRRLEFCTAHDGIRWYDAGPLGADSSGIVGYCAEGSAPGTRELTRVRADGATEVLHSWKSDRGYLEDWFLERPGGRLLRTVDKGLEAWDGKGWQLVGEFPEPSPFETKSVLFGRRFVALGKAAQAPVYFDAQWGQLVQLVDGAGGVNLAPLEATPLKNIFDAVDDHDGWILVAAANGLFRFRPEDGSVRRIPRPGADRVLKSLCRDAQGRLWAAGESLYLSGDEGQHWEVADLPMLGPTYTERVRANSADARGIVLALYDRGVVFVGW